MEITLKKKITRPTIIEGFPGFGLIGTIATEFFIEHLKTEKVGCYWFDDILPTIAIHNGRMIHPVGIYHEPKHNFLIIHSIAATQGIEWKAADLVLHIAQKTNAKEIIGIEGVGATGNIGNDPMVFYHTNMKENEKKLQKLGMKELKEGIIIGVTSAILMKAQRKVTSFFAETHSQLPDSKAAATCVAYLDKYLGINLDVQPLLAQAERLEEKLKEIIQKGQQVAEAGEKKQLSYVG